jgi:acyl-coenzyme A synthetase/AMP-(fatty) acid ligase/acyl carrier protein
MNLQYKLLESLSRYSGNISIYNNGNQITYFELLQNSLRIASFLSQKEIKNEPIGIFLNDPIQHISAITGVILSGNCYFSITSDNHYLVQQEAIKIPILLTEGQIGNNNLAKNYNYKDIIEKKQNIEEFDELPDYDENKNICIFSTSGSTGKPKFVAHSSKNILNDISRQIECNFITEKDTIDLLFSFSFSASLSSIFPALLTGGKIAVYSIRENGINALPEFWKAQKVSFSCLSASTFRVLCKVFQNLSDLRHLRFLSIGAEPVTKEDIGLFINKFPDQTILQVAYATTETRTISEYQITKHTDDLSFISSVGKPVRDRIVKIVSKDGKCLSTNIIGEIIVQSEFIAKEYLNDKHSSNPTFNTINNETTYKTGDLGYFDSHGYLYYTGRKKHETKLNGIKIDLYSIEKELEKIDKIQKAVVVLNCSNPERKTITACVKTNGAIDFSKVKTLLSESLPLTHLPNTFYVLDDFPLSHTGKINKNKLEEFVNAKNSSNNEGAIITQEFSSLENEIIKIWNDTLGTQIFNPDADFFNDFGGDSLNANLCVSIIESNLKIKIPYHAIYLCKTPNSLSKFIEYKLFGQYVYSIEINEQLPERPNIFFICDFNLKTSYEHYITELTDKFNLSFLYYDLYCIEQSNNAVNIILAKMVETLNKRNNPILIGHSFNGYIAFQLAALNDNIPLCILLDTPNYYRYADYLSKNKLRIVYSILKKVLIEFSFDWTVHYVRQKLKKRNIHKSSISLDNRFVEIINIFLGQTHHSAISGNCFYIKATSAFIRNPYHGYDWKNHVKGKFFLSKFHCDHLGLLSEKQAKKIAPLITQVLNKIDIKSNHI